MLDKRTSVFLGAIALLILAAYVVYPMLATFIVGLRPANIASVFSSYTSANVRAIYNTVSVSVYTVVGAGILGTALALIFYRVEMPFRRFLSGVATLPLALPPLVGVVAFLFLYSETGILPRAVQRLFGLAAAPFSFDGMWAVWLVHVYSFYVFFFLFVSAGLRAIDRSQYEASADLGAGGTATLLRVVTPQLKPALVNASLLVFMLSMASFTAPLLFAGTKSFMTLQIYNYKTNGSLELAAAVSCVLTIICFAVLLTMEFSGRRDESRRAVKGTSPQPTRIDAGIARVFGIAAASIILLFVVLPVATIVLVSFATEGSWTTQILPASYTMENYSKLVTDPGFLNPVLHSLWMATAATAANIVVGVGIALYCVKSRGPGKTLIRLLAFLPFAIPGTVVAINLIVTFNRPSALAGGAVLVGSMVILPLAYFVRNIPLVVRSTIAGLESFDDQLAEASADLGAGTWRTLSRVVFPVIGPAVVAGALLTFVAAVGEFVSSILLYVFGNRPISVEILSQLRIYSFGAAAAYSVFLMVVIVAAIGASQWLQRSREAASI